MKPKLQVGQRWLWTARKTQVLAEILDENQEMAVVLDISGLGRGFCVSVGSTFRIYYRFQVWEYLEGQDKPING